MPGLQGDVRSQVPYFTRFGQDKTPHPLLAALGKLLWEGSGAKDIVDITRALGGDEESTPPPGYLPFQGGMRLGGRYSPRTPGLRAETLQPGDEMIDFEGKVDRPAINPSNRAYNLLNEQDEIVASANRQVYPAGREQSGSAYIPSMWVREDYRKTPAMFDLYNILSRGGKTPLRSTFANKRLEKVFNKRMARQTASEKPKQSTAPKEEKAMDIVNNTLSGSRARQLALALEMERRGRIPDRTPTTADFLRREAENVRDVLARGDYPAARARFQKNRRSGV